MHAKKQQQWVLADDEPEQRLDRWLRRRLGRITQGQLEKALRRGWLRVDARRATASTRIKAGQQIAADAAFLSLVEPVFSRDRDNESRAKAFIQERRLYEDADILALDKPVGLAMQGGTGIKESLDSLLNGEARPRPYRITHRLDRPVGGVVVLARNAAMAAALAEQFRTRKVQKLYLGLVCGRLPAKSGIIDMPLGKQSTGPDKERVIVDEKHGKQARTFYRQIGVSEGKALVVLRPETGRTHQIRVHLAQSGAPLLGDEKYTGDAAPLLHLFCAGLTFDHPRSGTRQHVAALPGGAMRRMLQHVRLWDKAMRVCTQEQKHKQGLSGKGISAIKPQRPKQRDSAKRAQGIQRQGY